MQCVRGPLWNDWEDTFRGPLAWDLACLEAAAPPFGSRDPALIAAAVAGYGSTLPRETLAAFVAARRIQASVWGVVIALANGDLDSVNNRLDWFRHG
jgi:Ser/Thr protein kinase RdoA (MazF antagonist)